MRLNFAVPRLINVSSRIQRLASGRNEPGYGIDDDLCRRRRTIGHLYAYRRQRIPAMPPPFWLACRFIGSKLGLPAQIRLL
jgi:hypothetical protein